MSQSAAKELPQQDEVQLSIEQFVKEYSLSRRESDVLELLVKQVVSAEDISKHLGISRNTVRIHLKNINTKVGTTSKSELLGRFIEFMINHEQDNELPANSQSLRILMADDDPNYIELVSKASASALDAKVEFISVKDGQDLLDYFVSCKMNPKEFPKPNIVLLDLNMPRVNGFQALEKLKTDPTLSNIPVVIFSASSTPADIANIYALGGNSYVTKPGGYKELKRVMQGIVSYWGHIGALPG